MARTKTVEKRKGINEILSNLDLAARIFDHLPIEELRQLAAVNKLWKSQVRATIAKRQLTLDAGLIRRLSLKHQSAQDHIRENYKFLTDLSIEASDDNAKIPVDFYENLFNSNLRARRLVISGSGQWIACKCPAEPSKCGELYDSVKPNEMTNLEYIHIKSPFKIGSCTLLDLISRSPKLHTLIFCGLILFSKHSENFSCKFFHCDLVKLYWPHPTKKQNPSLRMAVRRNENITTLHAPFAETRELLSGEFLPNLKYLSLIVKEDWVVLSGKVPKVKSYATQVKYLSLAKKLEALELVAEYYNPESYELDADKIETFDDNYLEYKVQLWEQVCKLPNLKYLLVRGQWDAESICLELAKHSAKIEYLRLIICPRKGHLLCMPEGARGLTKLPALKAVQLESADCFEKLDTKTLLVFKELLDKIWTIDLNCQYTDEVDQLYSYLIRRGRQSGYKYKIKMTVKHIEFPLVISRARLDKVRPGQSLGNCVVRPTEQMLKTKVKQNYWCSWGLEIDSNTIDKQKFSQMRATWNFFNDLFNPTRII